MQTQSDNSNHSHSSGHLNYSSNAKQANTYFDKPKVLPEILLTTDCVAWHSSAFNVTLSREKQSDINLKQDSLYNITFKYTELPGSILIIDLNVNSMTSEDIQHTHLQLGLKLVGNRDMNRMSVFVCGIRPGSLADLDGRIKLGDQLLEVNDHVLYGLSHLNAAPIIRSVFQQVISRKPHNISGANPMRFVIQRHELNINEMALPNGYFFEVSPRSSRRNSAYANNLEDSSNKYFLVNGNEYSQREICREIFLNVHLIRTPEGFGFTLMQQNQNKSYGIYVSKLIHRKCASICKKLRVGDQLIAINEKPVVEAPLEVVNKIIAATKFELQMRIRRTLNPATETTRCPSLSRCASNEVLFDLNRERFRHCNECVAAYMFDDASKFSKGGTTNSMRISWMPGILKRSKSIPMISTWNTRPKLPMHLESTGVELPRLSDLSDWLRHHPIETNKETEIIIDVSRNKGLGINLIGGSETSKNHLIIHAIHHGGAIYEDGRLRPGDVIVRSNNNPLFGIPFSDAHRQLHHDHESAIATRNACSVTMPGLRFKIYRRQTPPIPWYDQEITVELNRKNSRGIGICIGDRYPQTEDDDYITEDEENINCVRFPNSHSHETDCKSYGVVVREVLRGSIADIDGRLQINDQILSVNGVDTRFASKMAVAILIKFCTGKITLRIGRLKNQVSLYLLGNFLTEKTV